MNSRRPEQSDAQCSMALSLPSGERAPAALTVAAESVMPSRSKPLIVLSLAFCAARSLASCTACDAAAVNECIDSSSTGELKTERGFGWSLREAQKSGFCVQS